MMTEKSSSRIIPNKIARRCPCRSLVLEEVARTFLVDITVAVGPLQAGTVAVADIRDGSCCRRNSEGATCFRCHSAQMCACIFQMRRHHGPYDIASSK